MSTSISSSKVPLRPIAIFGLFLICTGCDAQAERDELAKSPATQGRVQALVGKTLKQMVLIQPGSFWLGDFGVLMPGTGEGKLAPTPPQGPNAKPDDYNLPFTIGDDNKPPKWVSMDGFHIQSHKVTYGDFDVFVAANGLPAHPPQGEEESYKRIWQRVRKSDDIPAGVNWHQAKAYCLWLGKMTGLPFDLPTEAQWEFAASNRENSYRHPFPTQSGLMVLGKTNPAFAEKRKLIGYRGALYPAGLFEASPAGLYDLIWNGFDWVNDWYAVDAYAHAQEHNPTGPTTGTEKVLRGSSPGDTPGIGFKYLNRYHEKPESKHFEEDVNDLIPYTKESFRCVVNQAAPLTGNGERAHTKAILN